MLIFLARHLLRDIVRFLGIQFMRAVDMIRCESLPLSARAKPPAPPGRPRLLRRPTDVRFV